MISIGKGCIQQEVCTLRNTRATCYTDRSGFLWCSIIISNNTLSPDKVTVFPSRSGSTPGASHQLRIAGRKIIVLCDRGNAPARVSWITSATLSSCYTYRISVCDRSIGIDYLCPTPDIHTIHPGRCISTPSRGRYHRAGACLYILNINILHTDSWIGILTINSTHPDRYAPVLHQFINSTSVDACYICWRKSTLKAADLIKVDGGSKHIVIIDGKAYWHLTYWVGVFQYTVPKYWYGVWCKAESQVYPGVCSHILHHLPVLCAILTTEHPGKARSCHLIPECQGKVLTERHIHWNTWITVLWQPQYVTLPVSILYHRSITLISIVVSISILELCRAYIIHRNVEHLLIFQGVFLTHS